MILKSFELNKIKLENYNFYLFYGDNEGFKEEISKNFFEKQYQGNVYRYDEKEVLDNVNSFYNSILTKSFFDNKKLIIINRVSDKIRTIVEELIEKKTEDFEFNQDNSIEFDDEYRSPGWDRYKKNKILRWKK